MAHAHAQREEFFLPKLSDSVTRVAKGRELSLTPQSEAAEAHKEIECPMQYSLTGQAQKRRERIKEARLARSVERLSPPRRGRACSGNRHSQLHTDMSEALPKHFERFLRSCLGIE